MRYTVRPISDRTAFTGKPTRSSFTVAWSDVDELLDRELRHLAARNVVVEVDVPERGIRLDGQLRADARAASPAVRLAFDSKEGPLVYATDRFVPGYRSRLADWQHNLYAIALALEALRKVDRYGVTGRGEQYTGFKALGAGTGATPVGGKLRMSEREAAVVLGDMTGETGWLDEDTPRIYRRARALAHPDRHGGDQTLWDQVTEAGQVLGVQP